MRPLETFGKYILLERLAAGGMAEVYLAKSTGAEGIGRFFAIKRILPQYSNNLEFIDMFKEEAKLVMNLNHGNVVQIFEFGIEKSQFFLVMEFVEGQNLRQMLNHLMKKGKSLSVDQIAYIIKEVAAGLDHAHRSLDKSTGKPLSIIHRDMSPQNVMISFDGEVKIVDFGIAKAETQFEQTRAGTIKGKFGYMSPEQADGQTVDLRTDVFSLGIVLWELLTKERLFSAQNEAATLKRIRECNIPSLRKLNPSVPAELEKICHKALAKDRNLRYQSAGAFHRDLNRFLNTQFPEFSSQDFSVFMKSIYADMFLENRKKLANFAKLQAEPMELDMGTFTDTDTFRFSKAGEVSAATHGPPDGFDGKPAKAGHTGQVNLKELNISGAVDSSISFRKYKGNTEPSIKPKRKGSRDFSESEFDLSKMIPTAAFLIIATVTGWYAWNNREKVQSIVYNSPPPEPALQASPEPVIESASTQMVPMNIQSSPSGATVFIDGKRVGFTPYIGEIPANKKFQLLLTKDDYLKYDLPTEKAAAPGYTIKATMVPEPPMGFVSIDVLNAPPRTVVKINGRRLEENLPIRRYKIPAGTPIKVQAISPAGISAEQTVTVGQRELRSIKLNLSVANNPGQR